MSLKNIAILGANSQLCKSITNVLLRSTKQEFKATTFIPPNTEPPNVESNKELHCETVDLLSVSRDELKAQLKGIDAVVSALNGKALEAQPLLQDVAADAGVKRFYPSEYGFHNIYRKSGSDWGYIHPMWDMKARLIEQAVRHPAIDSGKMSYTLIGCGDFYNQGREKEDPEGGEYTFHVIGDPEAKADYTHIDDFANILVATLLAPEKSENAHLSFVSDTVSHKEIAGLVEKHIDHKVKFDQYSEEDMHKYMADPHSAPDEPKESAFPVDFWFLVKGAQGAGKFRRPKGEVHNRLFPVVKVITFDSYLKGRQAEDAWKEVHMPAGREAAEHPL